MELRGQKVVVVGAGSGIGRAIAELGEVTGMQVVRVGRSIEHGVRADVTREDDVRRMFAEVGVVDHVVSTAAEFAYAPVRELDLADARRAIDSKLVSSLLLAKHARVAEHGSITFTGGIASDRPMPRGSVVAALNGGLVSLVRALAIELRPVRVNVVSPGWVDTPVWDRLGVDKEQAFAAMSARLPVGRVGRAEEIAHAVRFLMENAFTTGAVLNVDGGHRFV